MSLGRLTQSFDAKKEKLRRLDQERAKLQQELVALKRQIQKELDLSFAPISDRGDRRATGNGLGRHRRRLTQRVVHDVLSSARKPLTRDEIQAAVLAIHPDFKTDGLDSILEMEKGPAIKAGSRWKANEKWVTKRGRPRANNR